MAVRPPDLLGMKGKDPLAAALDYELAAEMAATLGRAGKQAETLLAILEALPADDPERQTALKAAAKAVHAYFIQRELCGMRRHDAVIREMRIPQAVLVRLGAS
jgi:hypothetical protein